MELKRYKYVLTSELKYRIFENIIFSIVVLLFIYIVFGLNNISKEIETIVIERGLPVIGIIMISPLFQYELDNDLYDVLKLKNISIVKIIFLRLILRIILFTSIILIYGKFLNSESFDYINVVYHSLSLGLLFSSIGVFFFGITKNIVFSYLAPIIFLSFQWMSSYKKIGELYLFRWYVSLKSYDGFYLLISLFFLFLGVYFFIRKDK